MNYQTNGTITQGVGGLYTIRLDQNEIAPTPLSGTTVTCRARGVFRHEGLTPLPGDRVTIEVSVYDLNKGRITWRAK